MSTFRPGNQKHLTLEDRIFIQNELNKGTTFKDIARFLCKDPTTISKEVKSRRISDWYHKGTFYNAKNFCIHRYHCSKTNACGKITLCGIKCTSCPTCNQTCKDFEKERCSRLDKAPYVCNGCDKKINHCTIAHKYNYNAKFADRKYRDSLTDSRSGINMTKHELLFFKASLLTRLLRIIQNSICLFGHFTLTSMMAFLWLETWILSVKSNSSLENVIRHRLKIVLYFKGETILIFKSSV